MILEALKQHFETLITRRVRLPWTMPDGSYFEAEIFPHDRPEFLEALASLGVRPKALRDRIPKAAGIKEMIQAFQAEDGAVDRDAERRETAEREQREITRALWPAGLYGHVTYSFADAQAAAPVVAECLVSSMYHIRDGAERRLSAEEVAKWFASEDRLPRTVPSSEDGSDGESLYLGGEPENMALAMAILREAVQEHLFQRRIGPLAKGSGSTEHTSDGTEPGADSPGQSEPASPSGSGAVSTASATTPTGGPPDGAALASAKMTPTGSE